jgi:hypothetical protein
MNATRIILACRGRLRWGAAVLGVGVFAVTAAETNEPGRSSFSAFQVISDRNIFNPNRYARSAPRTYTPRVTRHSTSFTLAGIMSYSQGETPGTYAFFDGTSTELRKVLQPAGVIADFKVAAITFDSVTLQRETNQTILKVGMQMRQESAGHWLLATQSLSSVRSSYDEGVASVDRSRSNSPSPDPAITGDMVPADGSDTNMVENASEPDSGDQPGGPPPGETGASPAETLALPPGPGNDALQRLMLLRQQEEQRTGNR